MYRQNCNYENYEKEQFAGTGRYQVPELEPTHFDTCDWIGFHTAKRCKRQQSCGIHFFMDDYQFMRLWRMPDRYLPLLQQFRYIMTPDFSLYTDFPAALQIYNHYRKHWLGAYWQQCGMQVIPTIGWSDRESYEWCFDGEPKNSCVAVSSVGCMKSKENLDLFMDGYREMLERLKPTQVLFYGKVPDNCEGNIIQIPAFQERFEKL